VKSRQRLLGLSAILFGCAACSGGQSGFITDWAPFIKLGDITYIDSGSFQSLNTELDSSILGPEIAQVRFKASDNDAPGYESKNGDAAFLEPGTPIYRVNGYRREFLVATSTNGVVGIYEASYVPGAKAGRDILDLAGKVISIKLTGGPDATLPFGEITDPAVVEAFVSSVLDTSITADVPHRDTGGGQYFLAFHLRDGIVIRRGYLTNTGELQGGLILPQPAQDLIVNTLNGR
jgi:hypothetical protein